MLRALRHGVFLAAAVWAAGLGAAQAQTPLFAQDDRIDIAIEGPIGTLVRGAQRSTEAVPAALVYGDQRYTIQLAPRGMTRRVGGICNFPPLRIDFENNQLRETIFRGQNKLKLVTRCKPGGAFETLNLLEFTAYRLYNVVSPVSFRVRPMRVTYRDTARNNREEVQETNFVIEALDDVASRNHLANTDVVSGAISSSMLDPRAATRYAFFEFMIGNLDWDMTQGHPGEECCHNSKLLAATAATRTNVVPIPYDFDYSGFVNAPYAIPPEGVPVRSVRQRYYRGLCRFNAEVPAAITYFQSKREALLGVIAGETRLSDSARRNAAAYIEDFYAVLNDPAQVQRRIIDVCRR